MRRGCFVDTSSDAKSWWQTLPGIFTAAAATLTAITGLILALNQIGVFSPKKEVAATGNTATQSSTQETLFPKGKVLTTSANSALTLESQLYAGATSTIFLAKKKSGDTVVVKIFWRGLNPGSPSWDHFKNEQQAAMSLKHRNIVKVFDTGLAGGYPFVVMQYYRGGSLRDWLQTHDRMPGPDILSVTTQIADAIDFAHLHGVIHRDITPGNILMESDPQGLVALSDFGVARVFGAVQRNITTIGPELIGSPSYLAPEVIEGKEITSESDIYSFGVVFYQMITGKDPFSKLEGVAGLLYGKVTIDAPDVRGFRKDVPESVATRLAQVLNRDPTKRPHSARAVLSGIENAIRGF
jgi:eukaryotic-like serine/threonine-protein kinase